MSRVLTGLVYLFCALVLFGAWAAEPVWAVTGDVWGGWSTGSTVTIDGPTRVPAGKTLVIEAGVRIVVKTTAPFEIHGLLEAEGTASEPITVVAPAEWRGFRFEDSEPAWNHLHHVVFDPASGPAFHAVTSENSNLDVAGCSFWARMSCLDVTGGRLRAEGNRFLTVGLWSETVSVKELRNDVTDPCGAAGGNVLRRNMIQASVPTCDTCSAYDALQPFYTIGLRLEGSTNTCIDDNGISVSAPYKCKGLYVGWGVESGEAMAAISGSVVTVRSLDGWARGVDVYRGMLSIVQCDIDVGGGAIPWLPAGVTAGADGTVRAYVEVNSSMVQLDRGEGFFRSNGGYIYVDFITEWSSGGALGVVRPPIGPPDRAIDDDGQFIRRATVHRADPRLRMDGEWGAWRTFDEVRAYYSLLPSSPCIDAGDTSLVSDPDNSRADIGCFYYPHSASASESRPAALPSDASLMAPFPNPFNATAIIPFSVARTGDVRIVLYDVLGRESLVLLSGRRSPGVYQVPMSASGLSSGTYFVSLELDGSVVAISPVLLAK